MSLTTKLTPREFFGNLYGNADGWLTVFSINTNTGERFTDWFTTDELDDLVARTQTLSGKREVWFGVATRHQRIGGNLRGGADECQAITALWIDLDVAGPNHKGDKNYPDDTTARELVKAFPIPPSMIVRTGGGYHGYWLLDEPVQHEDAITLLARWGATWAKYMTDAGYEIDNVFDLPRVLRVPGTQNLKNGANQDVAVVLVSDHVYSYSDIVDNTEEPPPAPPMTRHVPYVGVERPGDDFNARHTGSDVLSMAGWTLKRSKRNGDQAWLHPWDPTSDESATVYASDGHTTVWSQTVPKFKAAISPFTPYDPYGLYARLFHDGNFSEASLELAKKGYGKPFDGLVYGDITTFGDTPPSDDQIAEIEQAGSKPLVFVGGTRHLDDIANELTGVLLRLNDPPSLFKHGDVVSQFTRGELEAVDRVRLVNVIESSVRPVVMRKDTVAPARVEVSALDLALIRLVDRLPEVQGVVRSPFLRADGTVCADIGYDHRSGNYLASTSHVAVPEEPGRDDVARAVALVDDMIADFPLKSRADRAHVFALMMTPLIRHLVPLTPLFILDGNGPGVGKNLLAESCMYVATGEWVQTDPLPTDAEEQRKQITALMSTGRSVALFDEAHIITGTSLARLITSTTWGDRLLGYSKQVSYPNRITVCALGNNVDVQGDMPRRSILIRLESQLARPYDRQDFRHDNLRDWVVAHRHDLVAGILTILVAWHQAGRPKGAARLGSFDAWAAIVGGALSFAGVDGFMSNVAEMRSRGAGDEQDMAAHLWELNSNFYGQSFTTKQVARLLEDDRMDSYPPRMSQTKNTAQALGHVYRHYADRWFDRIRLRQDGMTNGARRWTLETLPVDKEGDWGTSGTCSPLHTRQSGGVEGADNVSEASEKVPLVPLVPLNDPEWDPSHPDYF
jgi:hypothetical protein